jgi:hypothetical protein
LLLLLCVRLIVVFHVQNCFYKTDPDAK